MRYWDDQKGFTLVELIIGMAIMTIILGGICGVFYTSLKAQSYGLAKGNSVQDVSTAINQIAGEIQYAYGNSIGIMVGGQYESPGETNSNGHYNLDLLDTAINTNEIFFSILSNTTGMQETRHIYPKNNSIVIDIGPYPQMTNPWTVSSSVILAPGSVQGLSFVIDKLDTSAGSIYNDADVDAKLGVGVKRKKITITVTTNNNPTNAAKPADTSDPRLSVFTTTVVTSNMQ